MIVAAFGISRTDDWSAPLLTETGLIIDLAIIAPVSLIMCYWNRSTPTQRFVRSFGAICSGLLIVKWVIPDAHESVILTLQPIRWLGISSLVVFELWVGLKIFELVFRSGDPRETSEKLANETGLPTFATRLIVAEARFWQRVGREIRKLFGTGSDEGPTD